MHFCPILQVEKQAQKACGTMERLTVFLGHSHSLRARLLPFQPTQPVVPTCINVAVAHGMESVLAVTPTLTKEMGGQGLGHWEGLRSGRVTDIHHLVGRVQGLEAALVVLPEALCGVLSVSPLSSSSTGSS